ncbi:hypothetical protein Cgig2_004700 [Carnegiea gigantea]|uniref:Reverse transcriptase zinc-binding domain-containing protein n=1 Tax=Carnegiea gigantea TaxID=171969 RepID=A0A9Q1GH00_9CARY|nr:hypothetical protein Cgig2_004700 [Carnegiea gigantea]
MGEHEKVEWAKVIWARTNIPRHAIVNWVFIQHKLPTKIRLNKYYHQEDTTCHLCKTAIEDEQHLFFNCDYAKDVWREIKQWWNLTPQEMHKARGTKGEKQITSAIVLAAINHIWSARNHALFRSIHTPTRQTVTQIKEQVIHRILYLNTISRKIIHCIDSILKLYRKKGDL